MTRNEVTREGGMMTQNEHAGNFCKKPIRFTYIVCINFNANPRYHRTPVIHVHSERYSFSFYSKTHFMEYLKYWKISLDSLPPKFVMAINTLCGRQQWIPITCCNYSRINVIL